MIFLSQVQYTKNLNSIVTNIVHVIEKSQFGDIVFVTKK